MLEAHRAQEGARSRACRFLDIRIGIAKAMGEKVELQRRGETKKTDKSVREIRRREDAAQNSEMDLWRVSGDDSRYVIENLGQAANLNTETR